MKQIIILLVVVFTSLTVFSQEDFGGYTPGGGQFRMAFYGDVCKNLTSELSLSKCSQDQIKEYVAELKTPEIVEKMKLNVSTTITFDITEDGKVEYVQVKKSSGYSEIDKLCLEHIKKMKNWNPEINDDMYVASPNMNIVFKFKFTQKEK